MRDNGDMINSRNELQWVHGPQTVVMLALSSLRSLLVSIASMGPRSSDRGYVMGKGLALLFKKLQWVHGPQTVVMTKSLISKLLTRVASMGPRSSDRGYVHYQGR